MSQGEIDESLYSRQLYVLGKEAMQKMANSNVLVVGLGGVGVEIAKNVILAGVKSVTLYDPTPTELGDLGSQFYLREADIGQPRAAACVTRLAELNSYVPVTVATGDAAQLAAEYECTVASDISVEQAVLLDKAVRSANKQFVWVESRGLAGFIFNDFGKFSVVDTNGEEPAVGVVADITDGEVLGPDSVRHGLEDGDVVELYGAQPEAVNGEYKVKVSGPLSFTLPGLAEAGTKWVKGGEWRQIKQPQTLEFQSLEQQLATPEFFITDYAKFDRPAKLHIAFLAVNGFRLKHSRLPRPQNAEDAAEVAVLAKNVAAEFAEVLGDAEIDAKLLDTFTKQSAGEVAPVLAVLGGTAAQEVLKAVSGKFSPLKQWMYFDAFEALPEVAPSEAEAAPRGTRYDRYYAVLGKPLMDKIASLNVLLVGAGAIGCEVLKNWALLGLGSKGHLYVTDNDTIERSNLNRQFLFRPKDVGNPKSDTAAGAVVEMNPDLKDRFTTMTDKVGPETEHIFNEAFWTGLDLVTNALDNVEARTYVDGRCVFYLKPLIESGTLGTKGNTQVVVPNMTESYASSVDPPEQGFPLCTIRNFPAKIDHTIAWAKSLFGELFEQNCQNVNLYLTQANYVESTLKQAVNQKDALMTIQSYLVDERPLRFEQCVEWALRQFEHLYRNDIKQLLFNFPPDSVTSSGAPFWAPPKRQPTALEFDPQNPNHRDFVVAAANLRAFNFGLRGDPSVFDAVFASYKPSEFTPSSNVKIAANDEEAARLDANPDSADDVISQIAEKLPPPSKLAGFRLTPVDFEKDDDSNFHIAFINAASNLRAANYGIEPVDRSRTKFIAGRIIPAIATTTSLVTGLSTLEMLKVVQEKKIEDYKNGFVNLALPFFGFSEPMPSQKLSYGNGRSIDKIWGRFEIKGDITLQELFDFFEKEHELEVSMVTCGSLLLAASFAVKKLQERLPLKLSELVEQISKKPLADPTSITLEVVAEDAEGEDVDDLPMVVVRLQ